MNLKKFKEMISKLNNYKEVFASFRLRENNCYDYYQKEKELAVFDYDNGEGLEEREEQAWRLEWDYVAYETVVDLYNRLDWKIDEDFKEREKEYIGIEEPFPDYNVTFSELHEKLQKIEDDVEYAYAIFCIIKTLSYREKIYTVYARKLLKNIKELELEEYIRQVNRLNNRKVFIAMSFNSLMKEARKQIKQAVKDSGYRPILIDEKEYNTQITSEICKEIKESRFVVADLTQQRGGVYYEAGYALGMGKDVIFCCDEADSQNIHFDVAQINTIYWKDAEDLYSKLKERIQATMEE